MLVGEGPLKIVCKSVKRPVPSPRAVRIRPPNAVFVTATSVFPSALKSATATDDDVVVVPGDDQRICVGAPNPPAPFPRMTDASPPLNDDSFAVMTSTLVSPLKSATATLTGLRPTEKLPLLVKPPVPFPKSIRTFPTTDLFGTTRSSLLSPLKSATARDFALPTVNRVAGAKLGTLHGGANGAGTACEERLKSAATNNKTTQRKMKTYLVRITTLVDRDTRTSVRADACLLSQFMKRPSTSCQFLFVLVRVTALKKVAYRTDTDNEPLPMKAPGRKSRD